MTPIVEVEGVERSFGDTRALCGLDLAVPEGQRRRAARSQRGRQDHARAHPVDIDPARRGHARESQDSTW